MPKDLSVKIYSADGKSTETVKLDPKIFKVAIKEPLVHQVAVAQLANARHPLAHAKIRSEVRGGGRKPWRQKGTGRARHGSIRSPIWRGGGVTFGPTKNRNFSKRVNKAARQKAIRMVLTDRLSSKAIIVLDNLKLADYKTKDLLKILNKLPSKQKSNLIILPKSDQKVYRSASNLKKVETILADSLNVVSLLKYDYLIIIKDSLKKISQTFAK
ncbi:MAG: 50S ribosomal protein L4 [Patescibacteria group bacterium]